MLEIKAWQSENDTTVTHIEVNGSTLNDLFFEFIFGTTSTLEAIGKEVEKEFGKEAVEDIKINLMAGVIAKFVTDCTGDNEDAKFFENIADAATMFLQGNILLNSQDGREKMFELLEELVADNKPEQPEGEANGTE